MFLNVQMVFEKFKAFQYLLKSWVGTENAVWGHAQTLLRILTVSPNYPRQVINTGHRFVLEGRWEVAGGLHRPLPP